LVTVAFPRVNREGVPRSPVPKLRVAVRDDAYESVVDIVVDCNKELTVSGISINQPSSGEGRLGREKVRWEMECSKCFMMGEEDACDASTVCRRAEANGGGEGNTWAGGVQDEQGMVWVMIVCKCRWARRKFDGRFNIPRCCDGRKKGEKERERTAKSKQREPDRAKGDTRAKRPSARFLAYLA